MDAVWPCVRRISLWLGVSLLFVQLCVSQNRALPTETATLTGAERTVAIETGTILQVELGQRRDWKHLARNSVVEGRLKLAVFAGEEPAIPEGTKIELTIESVKKAGSKAGKWRKARNAVVRAFNPLEKDRPPEYVISLSKTEIEAPHGSVVVSATALRAGSAAMIEPKMGRRGEVHRTQESSEKSSSSRTGSQTVVLQLDEGVLWPMATATKVMTADVMGKRKARAFLLTQLCASQSRKDDVFQARLAEPVHLGDRLFETGSLLDGRVSKSTRPRMLSRAGSLFLRVERITTPGGTSSAVAGTLVGVEVNEGAKYVLDEEGGLGGLKPGVVNALMDLGIAYTPVSYTHLTLPTICSV